VYLITGALPYINGVKHLGNLIWSMLPADVYARFRRMQGHEVFFAGATARLRSLPHLQRTCPLLTSVENGTKFKRS
jgi:hypothetical protein